MYRQLVSLILGLACAAQLAAQVIAYEIDTSFNSGMLLNRGGVSDIHINEDDQILVTGMFDNFDSPASKTSLLAEFGGFLVSISGANFFKIKAYKDGYIHYGNTGVQRFRLPGESPPTYSFEYAKPAYLGSLSNMGRDAMVLPDDHILVAGRFFTDSTMMGTAESHLGLRQLCMVDSTGAPVADFPMIRCANPVNAYFWTVNQLSTGEYIVAGRFSEIEGHLTNNIAKLKPDFSVDTSFVSPLIFQSDVQVRYIDSQDRIWLTTGFGAFADNPTDTIYMCRLLDDGKVDTTYHIPWAINVLEDWSYPLSFGAYYEDIDGTFIVVGGFKEVNGVPRKGLAKIYDNGELVMEAFEDFGADEAIWGNWVSNYGAGIGVLRALPDGKLLLGGTFSSFGGEPYSCLVRLQPSGFVGTSDRAGRGTLKVYPNPARQYFHLQLPDGKQPLQQVQLCDMQGRTLRTWPATQGPYAVDVLPAGMYVVRASGKEGVYTQKLILEP